VSEGSLRQAEIVAALALGSDLGVGKPLEHSLSTCLLATGIARALDVDEQTVCDTYFASLLSFAGCTSDSSDMAELMGDEVGLGKHFGAVDRAKPMQMMGTMLRHVGDGYPPLQRVRMVATLMTTGMPQLMRSAASHCEVARGLAGQLRLAPSVQDALYAAYERWNGRGGPRRLKGEAIPLSIRIIHLAFDAASFQIMLGKEAAVAMADERAGTSYDPAVVECFRRHADELFAELDVPSMWDAVLAAEPGAPRRLPPEETDSALEAVAEFTDIKTPYTVGHSTGVARLAAEAAGRCRLPAADATALRRAGLVHDLGRVGVTATIWNKKGRLNDGEWEQVRLHPYYTERILSRTRALAPLGQLAALHHERLDGSGYHRCLPAQMLSPAARILAAADAYHAMTEPRPYRDALSAEEAAEQLRREVRAGKLDGDAANAVLGAAGHRVRPAQREWAGGLSEREVEVLRLLARGLSNRQMAKALFISDKTVGHHIQHIYDKIGCSTRPAATLFAMQHDLLHEGAALPVA
jgi:HD-GYP domain-containing protein (c-di-GMP phosphodiesterase class II)/DNA-binding CsgD family transcriptional regulator